MLSEIVTPPDDDALRTNAWALPVILRYFNPTAPSRPIAANSNSNDDPYLFVMLADQEVAAGRTEQAESLLDAAYAAFDRSLTSRTGYSFY